MRKSPLKILYIAMTLQLIYSQDQCHLPAYDSVAERLHLEHWQNNSEKYTEYNFNCKTGFAVIMKQETKITIQCRNGAFVWPVDDTERCQHVCNRLATGNNENIKSVIASRNYEWPSPLKNNLSVEYLGAGLKLTCKSDSSNVVKVTDNDCATEENYKLFLNNLYSCLLHKQSASGSLAKTTLLRRIASTQLKPGPITSQQQQQQHKNYANLENSTDATTLSTSTTKVVETPTPEHTSLKCDVDKSIAKSDKDQYEEGDVAIIACAADKMLNIDRPIICEKQHLITNYTRTPEQMRKNHTTARCIIFEQEFGDQYWMLPLICMLFLQCTTNSIRFILGWKNSQNDYTM